MKSVHPRISKSANQFTLAMCNTFNPVMPFPKFACVLHPRLVKYMARIRATRVLPMMFTMQKRGSGKVIGMIVMAPVQSPHTVNHAQHSRVQFFTV